MKKDFEMIVIPRMDNDIVIYPISDVHLGALECNKKEWELFLEQIKNEPNSYVILGGDLINNATRSSVSNVFEDIMRPRDQKDKMVEYLRPIKDKILCAVSGNHERRSGKDADDDPTYDIMCKLGIEDVYRENIAFVKVQLGSKEQQINRQCATYMFCVTHGAGGGIQTGGAVNRNERFSHIIDGIDCLIVGHTHKGTISRPSKISVDARNNYVSFKSYLVISNQAWLSYGGYACQKMLPPSTTATIDNGQKLVLNKSKKNIKVIW